MNKWCEKEIAEMIEAVAECKGPEDVCGIFDVVLTPREINDIARRYKILKMLNEDCSYADIKMTLGVGSDVISRVAGKIGLGFRRSSSNVAKPKTKKWIDPLQKKKAVYYKGVPSPGTMINQLKKH